MVGAGHVGATCSQLLAQKELAQEVILLDIVEGIPQGKGLDQWESAPIEGFDSRVIGANAYEEAENSEVFIVTAGIARKPGMSRDDLLKTNAGVISSVSREIKRVAPNAIVIVVTNPLDVMAQVALEGAERKGQDPKKIFGENLEMLEGMKKKLIDQYNEEGEAIFCSARLWDDGILDPLETRRVLGLVLSLQATEPAIDSNYGVFRM